MSSLRKIIAHSSQDKTYEYINSAQTYSTICKKKHYYSKLTKGKMTMKEALSKLSQFIDSSDPNLDLPNIIHAYQTAEAIRKEYPNDTALQVTGLIHDVGKILFLYGEYQWAIVGDTFIAGCPYPKTCLGYEHFIFNPDTYNKKYQTSCGIYEPNCGLDNTHCSFGHDEYLYIVLKNNPNNFPDKYKNIIRYHSLYPWHTHGEYKHLMNEGDYEMLKDVQNFNRFDLYSKTNDTEEMPELLINYYDNLLEKYFPEPLNW